MRALVAGVEAVLPDGSVHDGLTALKKDNRGYSLDQLLVGSEGTLGIITAAALKLVPAVTARTVAWAAVADPQAALDLLRALQGQSDLIEGFEIIPDGSLQLVLKHIPGPAVRCRRAPWHSDRASGKIWSACACSRSAGAGQIEDARCVQRAQPKPLAILPTAISKRAATGGSIAHDFGRRTTVRVHGLRCADIERAPSWHPGASAVVISATATSISMFARAMPRPACDPAQGPRSGTAAGGSISPSTARPDEARRVRAPRPPGHRRAHATKARASIPRPDDPGKRAQRRSSPPFAVGRNALARTTPRRGGRSPSPGPVREAVWDPAQHPRSTLAHPFVPAGKSDVEWGSRMPPGPATASNSARLSSPRRSRGDLQCRRISGSLESATAAPRPGRVGGGCRRGAIRMAGSGARNCNALATIMACEPSSNASSSASIRAFSKLAATRRVRRLAVPTVECRPLAVRAQQRLKNGSAVVSLCAAEPRNFPNRWRRCRWSRRGGGERSASALCIPWLDAAP